MLHLLQIAVATLQETLLVEIEYLTGTGNKLGSKQIIR